MKVDLVIIGAGISGSVLAERYASAGKKVLVLEKRDHIAGNCFDYIDDNGILISKYGAHLFHTTYKRVWEYVNRFADWYEYEHKVLAKVDEKLVPIPVNIETVNILFGLSIATEKEMKAWLEENRIPIEDPQNGKEAVLNKVGSILYEKMFRNYTKKQWDKYPEELNASVLNRIPVRTNSDNRYFSDEYQALPVGGYTKIFEKMLNHPNIEVKLNTDYFDVTHMISGHQKIFYTGPIDRFFEFKHSLKDKLEYRSINFEAETVNKEFFQSNSVVNYPGLEVNYTRIVEYKHFGNQKSSKTTIVKEYTTDEGDPYYPVLNEKNLAIYRKYQQEAAKMKNVYFVGRLANYKYFNMDEAFKNALELYDSLEGKSVLQMEREQKSKSKTDGIKV